MTGAEVREAITKGKIAADDALDAIAIGLKAKFDGATAGDHPRSSGVFGLGLRGPGVGQASGVRIIPARAGSSA